jgi:membrane-bound serine protease (ClpP class)
MLLIPAFILALIFLPWPANLAVIIVAGLCELSLMTVGVRYSRRRRAAVGAETLIGMTAETVTALAPEGKVKLNGEIWDARASRSVATGVTVHVRAVRGLTLEVE